MQNWRLQSIYQNFKVKANTLSLRKRLQFRLEYNWRHFELKDTFEFTYSEKQNKHIKLFLKLVFLAYISRSTWATKKLFTSICIIVWGVFRWKKKISNPVTKSGDICKNAVLPEKSKLLEKIRHFEMFKNFFWWI